MACSCARPLPNVSKRERYSNIPIVGRPLSSKGKFMSIEKLNAVRDLAQWSFGAAIIISLLWVSFRYNR